MDCIACKGMLLLNFLHKDRMHWACRRTRLGRYIRTEMLWEKRQCFNCGFDLQRELYEKPFSGYVSFHCPVCATDGGGGGREIIW